MRRDKSKGKIAMNKDNNVSEYKIGRTTHREVSIQPCFKGTPYGYPAKAD